MNKDDRKILKSIYEKLDEAKAMLEELKDSHQERVDNMQNAGIEGQIASDLEEHQGNLDSIFDELENVIGSMDEAGFTGE